MLVLITCPACRHRGHVVNRTLPRELLCSRCGSRNRFKAHETRRRTDRRSPRPSFVEQSLSPDDLVHLLWKDQFAPWKVDGAANARTNGRDRDKLKRWP